MLDFLSSQFGRLQPYFNTARWLGRATAIISAHTYPSTLVHPAYGYLFDPPVGSCRPKELERRLFASLEGRWWQLPNAFATQRASHYDRSFNLLWELSEQLSDADLKWHPDCSFRWSRLGQRLYRHPGTLTSLVVARPRSLYSWLFDALPRLCLLEPLGERIGAIYADFSCPFVIETLEAAQLGHLPRIDATVHPLVQAEQLIVPSYPLYSGKPACPVVPLWAVQWLRRRLGAPQLDRRGPTKRIFISRRDATDRFLEGEEQLFTECLAPRGFERYELSSMSFCQQRDLFADSCIVVAAHSAALSNLLFCRAGTQVLELFHPAFVRGRYWQLAAALGLEYHCLLGLGRHGDGLGSSATADIAIEPADLNKALSQLEARECVFDTL